MDVVKGRKVKKLHPHQQPVEVAEYLVSYFSEPGDVVVDPCAGAFTYAAACYRLGRRFIGCDLVESHVATGFTRIEEERAKRAAALATLERLLGDGAAATKRALAKTWNDASGLPISSLPMLIDLLPPACRELWAALPETRSSNGKSHLHNSAGLATQRF